MKFRWTAACKLNVLKICTLLSALLFFYNLRPLKARIRWHIIVCGHLEDQCLEIVFVLCYDRSLLFNDNVLSAAARLLVSWWRTALKVGILVLVWVSKLWDSVLDLIHSDH